MHVAVAACGCELGAVFSGLVEVAPVHDDLRSECADRTDLGWVRSFGHADGCVGVEQAGGVGDRLAVVAGRGRDESALALFRRELESEVDASADFEGTNRLV